MNARTTTVGIVLSGAALLMTACGSGTKTDASAASAPSTATTTAAAATTTAPVTTPAATSGSTVAATETEPPSTATGGPAACVTRDLEFAVEPSKGMGDVRSADVVITNVHAEGPCGVFGYGGLGLMDAQGAALPTNLTRLHVPAQGLVPQQVILAPGASALEHLEWTDTTATGGGVAGCVTSASVVITPRTTSRAPLCPSPPRCATAGRSPGGRTSLAEPRARRRRVVAAAAAVWLLAPARLDRPPRSWRRGPGRWAARSPPAARCSARPAGGGSHRGSPAPTRSPTAAPWWTVRPGCGGPSPLFSCSAGWAW